MTSATIEIFVRPIKKTFNFFQHIYIISTDSMGNKKILKGAPTTNKMSSMINDDLKVVYTDYKKANENFYDGDLESKDKIKIYTITGLDAEIQAKMDIMWEIGSQVNDNTQDYTLPLSMFGCAESIYHMKNSNAAGYIMAKAIGVDLKPILAEQNLWVPGINSNFDHKAMYIIIHDYIVKLEAAKLAIANDQKGLGLIINQSQEKLEIFLSHKNEYSSAEEYAKFEQLIKDLNLIWSLDVTKAYKYKMHNFNKDYYGHSPTEAFNKYIPEYRSHLMAKNGLIGYEWTVDAVDQSRVYYQVKAIRRDNTHYKSNEFVLVNKNSFYEPNYLTLIDKQCDSLAEFRTESFPFHNKLDEICIFAGDHTLNYY